MFPDAVCFIKFPTTHPVPAPKILPDVPNVIVLFPETIFPETKISAPSILIFAGTITSRTLFTVRSLILVISGLVAGETIVKAVPILTTLIKSFLVKL